MDIVCLQECVDLRPSDAPKGWKMLQDFSSEGRANVAILYREHIEIADWGIQLIFERKGDDLRPRYIIWLKLRSGQIVASVHRPPYRDRADWPDFDRALGRWSAEHPHAVIAMDSNSRGSHGDMLRRANLDYWLGVGIDGFAADASVRLTGLFRMAKLGSDHWPVVVTLTLRG